MTSNLYSHITICYMKVKIENNIEINIKDALSDMDFP